MARSDRHAEAKSVAQKRAQRNAVTHQDKLRFISQYRAVNDPTSKRSVDRQYRALKKFPLYLQRSATADQRKELKARGFFVTDKGVIVDGPRDVHRKPIPGAKLQIQKGGVIKWSTKQRRDLTIGLSLKEKNAFVKNPKSYINDVLERLRKTHPSLKAAGKDIQVRLQWGVYQATKDFSPTQFTKAYPFLLERKTSKAKLKVLDRLTGLHIVYHVKKEKR